MTTAHCKNRNNKVNVILGRFNASDESEKNWISREVAEWKVHEDFDRRKKFADIALIIVDKPVEFTNYIQPICLPSADQTVNRLNGISVGYGRVSEGGSISELPKESYLNTIDYRTCGERAEHFSQFLNPQQFCANGTGEARCSGKNLRNEISLFIIFF